MNKYFIEHRDRVHDLLEKNKVLIMSHRGMWGGIIVQNTIAAFENALLHGADLVEVDAAMSNDGVFYAFHDGLEPVVLGMMRSICSMQSSEIDQVYMRNDSFQPTRERVNKLDEVLEHLRGRCLINIDRSWFYWPQIIDLIKKMKMEDQIIIKSPVDEKYLAYIKEHASDMMYMPIIRTTDDMDLVKYHDIGLFAVELMFQTEDNPLVSDSFMNQLRENKVLSLANVLNLNPYTDMCAHKDDINSIMYGPDNYWGWCIRKGFNILQTDWPGPLKNYVLTL